LGNVLQGKNKSMYSKLVDINGKADPLKKTLLVFDEAHNLFSPDIKKQERPNVSAIIKAIDHSYKISGADSVRVLLLTATPILNNPVSLLSLLNMVMDKHERFEINIDDFLAEFPFLSEDTHVKEEAEKDFIERITGKISYLNREKDGRQFAKPIIKDMYVDVPQQEDLSILKTRVDAVKANYDELKCKQKDLECKKNKAELKAHHKELKTTYESKQELNSETLIASIDKCLEDEKKPTSVNINRPYIPRPGSAAYAHLRYRDNI
jgi:superfamily II DNA or RNA helicase